MVKCLFVYLLVYLCKYSGLHEKFLAEGVINKKDKKPHSGDSSVAVPKAVLRQD